MDTKNRLGTGLPGVDRPVFHVSILLGTLLCGYLAVQTVGCGQDRTDPIEDTREVQQVCELCGTVWHVIPLDGKPVPPTIEWCFHDGCYCDQGLDLVIQIADLTEPDPELEARWIQHCHECLDCRRAGFTPESWKKQISER